MSKDPKEEYVFDERFTPEWRELVKKVVRDEIERVRKLDDAKPKWCYYERYLP